jgi:C_GCAxxG_C_C family probable redox protein
MYPDTVKEIKHRSTCTISSLPDSLLNFILQLFFSLEQAMSEPNSGIERANLSEKIGERAKNLFLTRQLLCSEAVLVAINKEFVGGLSDDMAIRLASALPVGLGNSGCLCGALSGATLAVGLFLGRSTPGGPDELRALNAANLVHDRFKDTFGATCCRSLTKRVKDNKLEHLEQCGRLTGEAAAIAALIILERRPELVRGGDTHSLTEKDLSLGSKLRRLINLARS